MIAHLLALLLAHLPTVHAGRGTIFGGPGDRHAGGHWACAWPARRVHQSPEARELEQLGQVVALWGVPCWSRVAVCSLDSGRCSVATVADRGPRRAAIDLDFRFARWLGHRGGAVSFAVEGER